MKNLLLSLALLLSTEAFAGEPYIVKPSRWGQEAEVTLPGVTGDLFATEILVSSKGPNWKKAAEAYIEDKTDAIEVLGKIEDGTISEECNLNWESLDYIEADSLSYSWRALKPVRASNAKTILYVVDTFGNYVARLSNGKKVNCPYLIDSYVFLNTPSIKFLGRLAD